MVQFFLGVALLLLGGFLVWFGGHWAWEGWTKWQHPESILQSQAPQMSAELIPANKPTPPNACGTIPPKAIALLLGSSAAYNSSFPHTVIEVSNQPLLIINKKGDRITISAKFFSRDNRIVGELKDNQFYINPNNYFRIERPDEHSLIVYDQENNRTIDVEFLNPSAIRLLGRFYLPDRPPIIIEEDSLILGGLKMSRHCFGENRVDIGL